MPKSFFTQFSECRAKCLNKKTKFFSFKKNPDLLPAIPSPKMFQLIKSNKWQGVTLLRCFKFGGICSGGNVKCRAMRGLPAREVDKRFQ